MKKNLTTIVQIIDEDADKYRELQAIALLEQCGYIFDKEKGGWVSKGKKEKS
jgi:hypothetical protein